MKMLLKNIGIIVLGIIIGMIVNITLIIIGGIIFVPINNFDPMNAINWDFKYFIVCGVVFPLDFMGGMTNNYLLILQPNKAIGI